MTGEEEDNCIFQQRAKLYTSITTDTGVEWKEKGVGNLKLNELKDKKHRLIMRTEGTQRLLLNFLIFNGMSFSSSGEKKVTFTGFDLETQQTCTFLVRFNKNEHGDEFLSKLKEVTK